MKQPEDLWMLKGILAAATLGIMLGFVVGIPYLAIKLLSRWLGQ